MSQRSEYHPEPEPDVLVTSEYIGPDRRTLDPVARLARRLNHVCTNAVDPLQIAAAVESDGITDRIARDEYGYSDVFDLAEELFRQVPRRLHTPSAQSSGERWQTIRELLHGPLFVLPSVAYPAVLAVLGAKGLVWGLVLSTAAGWVWGLVMTWLAYRLIGRGFREEAARLMLRYSLIGIVGVQVASLLAMRLSGEGQAMALFALSQMTYQMAASILIVYRLESWLFFALLPALLSNGVYLALGAPPQQLPFAIGASLLSVLVALGAAYWAIFKTPRAKHFRPTLTHQEVIDAWPILLYGTFSAALVLFENVRNMVGLLELSLSITPLVLSMGVLEWQSRRFRERAVLLLRETRSARDFDGRVWRIFLETLGASLLALFLVSAAGLLILDQLKLLTAQGLMMFVAHFLLGGVFFVNFILLAHSRFHWVLSAMGGALAFYLMGASLPGLPSQTHVVSFLLTTSLLFVTVTVALRRGIGHVLHYR